jgi:acyl-CoA reductase-like NAD-dependent aldehyde dehydrogenase
MYDVKLLIGGKERTANGGATFERRNPVSGAVVSRAAAASTDDALAAVAAAHAAFPAWSAQGPGARRAKLNKAAELLEAHAADFAAAVRDETGSTAGWGHFNVHVAASMLREAASMTTQVSGEVVPSDVPGNLAMAHRQPVGVVYGIAPWNAPVILGVRAVAMPLACGNTVVLKSSEVCPQTHHLIGQVLVEAGLGDGVINVIHTDIKDAGTVSEAVIAHPAVKRVNFTGSTRVG